MINEVLVFFTSLFLLLYSDMLLEDHRSDKVDEKVVAMDRLMMVGWVNFGLIALILTVNLLVISYETLKSLILRVKRLCTCCSPKKR